MRVIPYGYEKFDRHITELKNPSLIIETRSTHRTRVFIVNKHSEIVRGKCKEIFNYKRLNDTVEEEKYHLSNKEALITEIKNTLYIVNLIKINASGKYL